MFVIFFFSLFAADFPSAPSVHEVTLSDLHNASGARVDSVVDGVEPSEKITTEVVLNLLKTTCGSLPQRLDHV